MGSKRKKETLEVLTEREADELMLRKAILYVRSMKLDINSPANLYYISEIKTPRKLSPGEPKTVEVVL